MRLPIRTRLTLLFAVLVALVLMGTGTFVHSRVRQDLRSAVEAGLSSRAQSLLAGIDNAGLQFGDEGNLIELDQAFSQIVSVEGALLESTPSLGQRPLLPESAVAELTHPTYFDVKVRTSEETVNARVLAAPSDEGPIVVVGASLEEQEEAATRLAAALLLGGSGALAITTLIGWLLAGAALRPVERMRAEAAAISADHLGERLKVPDTGDELARLGETLNEMLARLEQTIDRERRFVDDASHELRTPLGILKTELELALRKARSPEELQQALRSAAEESERLNSLAEDLLVLARSDRGRLPVRREDTDLLTLIGSVTSRFRVAAETHGIALEMHAPTAMRVHVDPTRLQQTIGNLVDNAVRHSPPGGSVHVRVSREPGRLRIAVSDDGPGFPEGAIDKIFEPFTRIDPGRTRSAGGAGLGLAIVKAIIESHGGTVEAANDSEGGAVVTIDIPV